VHRNRAAEPYKSYLYLELYLRGYPVAKQGESSVGDERSTAMKKDWMYLSGITYLTYPQGLPNLKRHVLMT